MRYEQACSMLGVDSKAQVHTIISKYSSLCSFRHDNRRNRAAYSFLLKSNIKNIEKQQKTLSKALKTVYKHKQCKDDAVTILITKCTFSVLQRQAVEFMVNSKFRDYCIDSHYTDIHERVKEKLSAKIDILLANNQLKNVEYDYFTRIRRNASDNLHFAGFQNGKIDINALKEENSIIIQLIDRFINNNRGRTDLSYLKNIAKSLNDIDNIKYSDIYNYINDQNCVFTYGLVFGTLMRFVLEFVIDKALIMNAISDYRIFPQGEDGYAPSLKQKITAFKGSANYSMLDSIRYNTNQLIHVGDVYFDANSQHIETHFENTSKCYHQLMQLVNKKPEKLHRLSQKAQSKPRYTKAVIKHKTQLPFEVVLLLAFLGFLFILTITMITMPMLENLQQSIIDWLDSMANLVISWFK